MDSVPELTLPRLLFAHRFTLQRRHSSAAILKLVSLSALEELNCAAYIPIYTFRRDAIIAGVYWTGAVAGRRGRRLICVPTTRCSWELLCLMGSLDVTELIRKKFVSVYVQNSICTNKRKYRALYLWYRLFLTLRALIYFDVALSLTETLKSCIKRNRSNGKLI